MYDKLPHSLPPQLLLVTSTIPPSPGPYPGVASVPAPTPANDADQNPQASPKRENVDSTADIIISESKDADSSEDIVISESKDVLTADEHMAEAENTESKERSMDVDTDAPQPSETIEKEPSMDVDVDVPQPSETIAAEQSAEQPSEVAAGKDEEQPVDEVNTLVEPPPDTSEPAPMVDDNESKGDAMESST